DNKDINISEADEQKYYDEHKNNFHKKERVKIKYIYNSKDLIAQSIKISEDEVKAEYNKNIHKYSYPAQKAFSVIFVTDKAQAYKITKELATGANFEQIAQTLNTNNDMSAYGKNGSLGWFAEDNSLPEVFKKANLKKINQISTPIPTDEGFAIIKLDGIQPSKSMDLDLVGARIEASIANQKIQKEFNAIEDKIKVALSESPKSLEELAEKTGLTVNTTDWTTYQDPFSIMIHPEISDLVFSEEMIVDGQLTHKISDLIPIERKQGSYDFVIQVTDNRPEGIAPFDEVKDTIKQQLTKNISDNRFKSNVENLLTELNTTGKSDKIRLSQRYELNRDSTNLDKQVVDMVFNLEQPIKGVKSVTYGAEFLENNTAYIVALTKVDTPTEYQDISSELLPLFVDNTYYYLRDDIRSKSKIEIMPDVNM
ncbi:peptidyl-prolyl cis-trans isomerase, partial [Gilliamella apis]